MPRRESPNPPLTYSQRVQVKKELEIHEAVLCHDAHNSIRRSVQILVLLALPKRLRRSDAIQLLAERLAVRRDKQQWGRPWTWSQLRKSFYCPAFRRARPRPVTPEEWKEWERNKPPAPAHLVYRGKASLPSEEPQAQATE